MNVNATQICIDQGYDGKITEYGIIQKRTPTLCRKTAAYPGSDLNDFGDNVGWRCEMKGR